MFVTNSNNYVVHMPNIIKPKYNLYVLANTLAKYSKNNNYYY